MRSSLFYPHPKYPRLVYSNTQLPDMYTAAFAVMGKQKFEAYFRSEITRRWETKQQLQQIQSKVDFLEGDNPAAFGKFMGKLPEKSKQQHISDVQNGMKQFEELRTKLVKMTTEIQGQLDSLYKNDRLVRWADEQLKYCEEVLTKVNDLIEVIEADKTSLGVAEEQLKAMFITSSGRKQSAKSRRKRESKKKAKRMGRARQRDRAQRILHCLIPGTTMDELEEVSPLCHGNVEALLTIKKSSLLKGLNYLANLGAFSISLGKDIRDLLSKHHEIDWEWFQL